MWSFRNKQVHNRNGTSVHIIEHDDIQSAINHEWDKGLQNLPPTYSTLFPSHKDMILSDSIKSQRQWLASVWSARDRHQDTVLPIPTTNTSSQRYSKWKNQKASELQEQEDE